MVKSFVMAVRNVA
jgi:hypothetical protein